MRTEIAFEFLDNLFQDAAAVDSVLELLQLVEDHDQVAPLSEAFVRGVQEDRGHVHVVAWTPDRLAIGVAAVDPDRVVELTVAPAFRHGGLAGQLIASLRDLAGVRGAIDVWAHGDLPEAQRFVAKLDSRRTRELLKMRVRCAPGSARFQELQRLVDAGRQRAGELDIEVLSYTESVERFGQELVDEQWLRVNNEAFAWHPEQGGWSLEQLEQARNTAWFDPAGVLLAWRSVAQLDADAAGSSDGAAVELPGAAEGVQCLGFHWTKIPLAERAKDAGTRAGEVYVVCVADAARGLGFGHALTALGIGHLLQQGCGSVELYVEGDNAPAIATYRKLGFDVVHTDVVYRGQL